MNPRILNLISAFLIFGLPWFLFTLFDFRSESWDIGIIIIVVSIQLFVLLVVQIIAHFRTQTTSLLRLGALGLAWVLLAGVKLYVVQNEPNRKLKEEISMRECQIAHINSRIQNQTAASWFIDQQFYHFRNRLYVDGYFNKGQDSLYDYRSFLIYLEVKDESSYETKVAELSLLKQDSKPSYVEYGIDFFKDNFPKEYEECRMTIEHAIPTLAESEGGLPHPCHFSIKKEPGNRSSEEAGEGAAE